MMLFCAVRKCRPIETCVQQLLMRNVRIIDLAAAAAATSEKCKVKYMLDTSSAQIDSSRKNSSHKLTHNCPVMLSFAAGK